MDCDQVLEDALSYYKREPCQPRYCEITDRTYLEYDDSTDLDADTVLKCAIEKSNLEVISLLYSGDKYHKGKNSLSLEPKTLLPLYRKTKKEIFLRIALILLQKNIPSEFEDFSEIEFSMTIIDLIKKNKDFLLLLDYYAGDFGGDHGGYIFLGEEEENAILKYLSKYLVDVGDSEALLKLYDTILSRTYKRMEFYSVRHKTGRYGKNSLVGNNNNKIRILKTISNYFVIKKDINILRKLYDTTLHHILRPEARKIILPAIFDRETIETIQKSMGYPSYIDFLLMLMLDTFYILEKINIESYSLLPENDEAQRIMQGKNGHSRFFKYIDRIIVRGKPMLALYLLNTYGRAKSDGDKYLYAQSYIGTYDALEKYELASKYYRHFTFLGENIEYLQKIANYFIGKNLFQEAEKCILLIEKLEPKLPEISHLKNELDNKQLVKKILDRGIDTEKINSLSGVNFENLLIKHFEDLKIKVNDTPKSGDFGADIIVENKNRTRFAIQCKRFNSKVNLKAVQEVIGAIAHYNCDIGIVITNSTFLNGAIKLAESNDVELWDAGKLMKFLSGDISFSEISRS